MKDYGHLLRDDPEWAERAAAFSSQGARRDRAPGRGRAARRRGIRCRCGWPTTTPATWPTPRACARSRASCCARSPGSSCVEPAEWEICCGSAGVYNMLQPEPAAELGRRKAANLLDTGAEAVVAAQPRLRAADRRAHASARASALRGLPPDGAAGDVDRGRTDRTRRGVEVHGARRTSASTRSSPTTRSRFVGELHRELRAPAPGAAATARASARRELDAGGTLDFLAETRDVREGDWQVAPAARRPRRTAASRSPARPTARW